MKSKKLIIIEFILGFFLLSFFRAIPVYAQSVGGDPVFPDTCVTVTGFTEGGTVKYYFGFLEAPFPYRELFLKDHSMESLPPLNLLDSIDCIYGPSGKTSLSFDQFIHNFVPATHWHPSPLQSPKFLRFNFWPSAATQWDFYTGAPETGDIFLSRSVDKVPPRSTTNKQESSRVAYILQDAGNSFGMSFYLGNSEEELPAQLGSWNLQKIALARGDKKNVKLSFNTKYPNLAVDCKNCVENEITKLSSNSSTTLLLNIDVAKIKNSPLILTAKRAIFTQVTEVPIEIGTAICGSYASEQCNSNSECWWFPNNTGAGACFSKSQQVDCSKVPRALCGTDEGTPQCVYLELGDQSICSDLYSAAYQKSYQAPGDDYHGPLPPCAFDGSCRNVNDLIQLFINFGTMTLGIVGTAALVFFVYGGVMMIVSAGNADRVKKGKDILVAAIVGIVIAFSAYALINFVLDALDVSQEFRVIKDN